MTLMMLMIIMMTMMMLMIIMVTMMMPMIMTKVKMVVDCPHPLLNQTKKSDT